MAIRPKDNVRPAQRRRDGFFSIRVHRKQGAGRADPRLLLKCGCCDEQVEIHYGRDHLEINGVIGSLEDWRAILGPLLEAPAPERKARR